MLRAGPFSDERVVRLANRRFVPFYFDLGNEGFAGDRDARAFVVKQRPELGGRAVPTPPVLFMTPEGEVVGEVSNYASTEQVLRAMQKVLAEQPKYAAPSEAEQQVTDPLQRAEIAIELLDDGRARKLLAKIDSDRAHYLLGRLARRAGDWKEMRAWLDQVEDPALAADVRMEKAHELWQEGDFEQLAEQLAGFPKSSARYTEARYHEGLAHYHLGEVAAARAIWKSTIKACTQDPWIYRADWAYANTGKHRGRGRLVFSSAGRNAASLLHRIGYMGRANPDLKRR